MEIEKSIETAPERVLSLRDVADSTGVSLQHVRNLLRDGIGPELIRMGARRVGVRMSAYQKWLDTLSAKPGDAK